jgi:hypothetical protein
MPMAASPTTGRELARGCSCGHPALVLSPAAALSQIVTSMRFETALASDHEGLVRIESIQALQNLVINFHLGTGMTRP